LSRRRPEQGLRSQPAAILHGMYEVFLSRRIIEISTGAVLIGMGPIVATLVYWANHDLEHRRMVVPALSLFLMIGWLALISLFLIMVRVRNDNSRSEGLVERLSNAVHQTADAVFITDRSGVIEYVNPAFERITGYSSDDVLGKTPRVLKSGEQGTDYYDRLWRTVLAGDPFHGTPINRKPSGALYHAEQTITPMITTTGSISHFVSVLRDMTDRRLFEEQQIELRLAASIQRKLLPQQPPQLEGWELAGSVVPTVATCGDYFDFVTIGDDLLCLVVADACGHGVGPALIAVQTRAHLRSLLCADLELDEIFSRLNQILTSDLEDGLFVTMAVTCVEASTGSLVWANAGHPTTYVFDAAGAIKNELPSTGLPLGLLADRPYTVGRGITIEPGDVVLTITDGFLEAQNAEGVEFGRNRLCEVMRTSVSLPAEAIVQRLHEAVRIFSDGKPQNDDLTAVVCRRKKAH
jgi:sigma-B regulation protein RsbU (phosphoserine phosphatase)